jgi:hypothetical protein
VAFGSPLLVLRGERAMQTQVRTPMPPIIGGVTYQRLCSDFAVTSHGVTIVCLTLPFESGLRGQVGVEGLDIGSPVELLRDPMHEVILMQGSQGPAGRAGSTARICPNPRWGSAPR